MSDKSKIEWTDATWNPVSGCTIVSPGCTNCYAMKQAHDLERRFGSKKYGGLTRVVNGNPVWTGEVRLDEVALLQPLKWKRGRRIFVNSMSDLFHEGLPDEAIDRVFAVMALCPQHTFQVLTKRAERMRSYCGSDATLGRVTSLTNLWLQNDGHCTVKHIPDGLSGVVLPNVWLGVSAERQQEADERIPLLLQTPAAVRFISAEPLLGPIDLTAYTEIGPLSYLKRHNIQNDELTNRIDWVIIGGESGKGARVHDLQWSRDLIEQCQASGVAVFEKQLGSAPFSESDKIAHRGCAKAKTQGAFYCFLNHSKGGDWSEWPEDLRVRQFPTPHDPSVIHERAPERSPLLNQI